MVYIVVIDTCTLFMKGKTPYFYPSGTLGKKTKCTSAYEKTKPRSLHQPFKEFSWTFEFSEVWKKQKDFTYCILASIFLHDILVKIALVLSLLIFLAKLYFLPGKIKLQV